MNHPTDQVEELVLLSDQAIACDDYSQAALFLKRALEIAPLRKDLRAQLARVLAHEQPVELDRSRHEPEIETRPMRNWESPAPAATATRSSLSALKPLPSTTGMRGSVDAASLSCTAEPRSASRPRVSVRTEGNVNLQLDEEPISFSETAADFEMRPDQRMALHRLLEDEDEEEQYIAPPPAPKRRRRRVKLVNQGPTIEDWIASFAESCARKVRQVNATKMGYIACYVGLIVFVGYACYRTNHLFGSQKLLAKASSKPALQVPEPKQAAVEVPSLFSGLQEQERPARNEESILAEAQQDMTSRNYDHAISLLEPVIESGSRSALRDKMRDVLGKAYDSKGTALLQHSSFADSAACYRKSAAFQPEEPQYKVHLANALYYLGKDDSAGKANLEEACRLATEVTRIQPQYISAYEVLASAQEALGNNTGARIALQRIVSLSAKDSSAHKRASEHLQSLGKGA